jgi:hypothetical protein
LQVNKIISINKISSEIFANKIKIICLDMILEWPCFEIPQTQLVRGDKKGQKSTFA